ASRATPGISTRRATPSCRGTTTLRCTTTLRRTSLPHTTIITTLFIAIDREERPKSTTVEYLGGFRKLGLCADDAMRATAFYLRPYGPGGRRTSRRGRRVCFTTCGLLVQSLLVAKRDLRLSRVLKRLGGFEVLLIDDLGMCSRAGRRWRCC